MANVKATDLIDFTRASTGTYLDSDGTLKTAANNIPRIEYDVDGNLLGLLIEEARTNQILYSEDFSNSYWNKTECTVSQAPVAAPDGTMTATHVVKTGSNGHLARVDSFSASASGTIWIRSVSGTGTVHTSFHPTSLVTVTEEWQRLPAVVLSANGNFYAVNFRGDATLTEVYIWGAQLEVGSFPTSYIKTQGSTVSRAADVASIDVDQFGYNQSEGTVVVEATNISDNAFGPYLSDGTSSERIFVYINGGYQLLIADGGTTVAQIDGGNLDSGANKISAAYKLNDSAVSLNGGSVVTDTSCTMPTVTKMNIGTDFNGSTSKAGHIKSINYYPKRLSNAKLQELTS